MLDIVRIEAECLRVDLGEDDGGAEAVRREAGGPVGDAGADDLVPDDDVVARARKFGRLGARMVKALETTPVSVRIDFTE